MPETIESLLTPLLTRICEYSMFRSCGLEVSQEVMEAEIGAELNTLKTSCESVPLLHQQYRAIYKPLIFFIDYTIKESGFSFSASYQELARAFNEYSGDDKFFDLLEECLRRDDDRELTRLFYLFLGLGFDGYFKRHRADTLPVMKRCLEKLPPLFNPVTQPLTPEVTAVSDEPQVRTSRFFSPKKILVMLLLVASCSFVINYFALSEATAPYEMAVDNAAQAASPYTSGVPGSSGLSGTAGGSHE